MFKDFIDELNKALNALGIDNTERYVEDYTTRYNVLRASGKSEFESVLALGDPVANAHAIAGHSYTANEQIANNLLKERVTKVNEDANGSVKDNLTADFVNKANKTMTSGEKVFYTVLLIIAACLTIAFVFVTALIGIISVGYLFLAWFDFSGVNRVIVFGFAIIGIILFVIFAVIAALIMYKLYRFTFDNLNNKPKNSAKSQINL